MKGIGTRLKQERLRLKLSQSALGSIGGVETNAQGNYESGIRSPRADYLSRIAQAGVDINYLVTGLNSSHAPAPTIDDSQLGEPLIRVVARLHNSLHDVTLNLYKVTRLMESCSEPDSQAHTQLENIKKEAEDITLATVRLIYKTSRLT